MTLAHLTGAGGLLDGLLHPFAGADHLLAMVVVGTLAFLLRDRLRWMTLPAVFVGGMAVGGGLGIAGVSIGATELIVAASVALLGVVLLAATSQVAVRALTAVVAVAALFHGLAHGAEVPAAASPALYVAGFLLATATLHLTGVVAGPVVARWRPVRALAGTAVAAVGVLLVAGV